MKVSKKELFYNRFSNEWDSVLHKVETEKRMNIVFSDLLKGVSLKNKKFLEVGCGLGYFSLEAKKRNAKVTGVDVGEKLLKICKKKVPSGKFILASGADLPFKANHFDAVLCTEVIEHTEEPIKVIDEVIRVLKPGGVAVITSPNKVFKPLFDFLGIVGARKYEGNENWFSIDSLKEVINSHNVDITNERYFNFFYPMKLLDFFERFSSLKKLMVNQGYLIRKL